MHLEVKHRTRANPRTGSCFNHVFASAEARADGNLKDKCHRENAAAWEKRRFKQGRQPNAV